MINVDKVTKKFDDFTALDEMTLNVKKRKRLRSARLERCRKIHTAAYPCRNIQAGQRQCNDRRQYDL